MVMPPSAQSPVPVPVQPEKNLPMPALSAALGMALSYYFYPLLVSVSWGRFLLLFLLFLLVGIVSFLRALCLFPGENVPAFISRMSILAVAVLAGFVLGIAAGRTSTASITMGLPAERVASVSGVLIEDPRSLQGGSGLGILKLKACGAQGGLRATARGRLTVFFPADSIPRLKEFGRGCEILAEGRLSQGSRGFLFSAASVHIVKAAPALESFRTDLRMKLLLKFQSRQGTRPPVWGSLASALLLGVRDDLDTDLSAAFRNSGCAHILALSGMHLAIVSGVLAFLFRRLMGMRWASLVGTVFILLYVFVVGPQPSLVRSIIMYLIGTFALWGLLKGKPISLLCMAFIVQLLFQSETGTSLSFILSYLALMGILTLGEDLRVLFRSRLPEIVSRCFSASLGAFVFTAPVVVLFFGSLRPIGIIAGLLAVPISSLFIVLSLAVLVVSFLPLPLWGVFDFMLTWVYRLLELTVSLAGRVRGFSISNPIPVLVFSVLFWLLILFIKRQDDTYRNSIASFD